MRDALALFRPRQWPKNFLVFAALLFSGGFTDLGQALKALAAFASFTLLSSGVYALNDAMDAASDRSHPLKKHRPVAAGRISVAGARGLSLLAFALGLGLGWHLGGPFFVSALGYMALNVAYSVRLKHEVILDVFAVAAGFVLRAVAGGLAIQVSISPWLLVCTTLLALFLAFSKRRAEIELLKGKASSHRKALNHYSLGLLDQMIAVVASATLVAYSLYAFNAHVSERGPLMMLTVPYVLYGILRYFYLSHQKGMAGQPERVLLSDRATQINLVLYVLTAALILLYGRG